MKRLVAVLALLTASLSGSAAVAAARPLVAKPLSFKKALAANFRATNITVAPTKENLFGTGAPVRWPGIWSNCALNAAVAMAHRMSGGTFTQNMWTPAAAAGEVAQVRLFKKNGRGGTTAIQVPYAGDVPVTGYGEGILSEIDKGSGTHASAVQSAMILHLGGQKEANLIATEGFNNSSAIRLMTGEVSQTFRPRLTKKPNTVLYDRLATALAEGRLVLAETTSATGWATRQNVAAKFGSAEALPLIDYGILSGHAVGIDKAEEVVLTDATYADLKAKHAISDKDIITMADGNRKVKLITVVDFRGKYAPNGQEAGTDGVSRFSPSVFDSIMTGFNIGGVVAPPQVAAAQ